LFSNPLININDNTHEMLSVAGYGQATLGFTEELSLTGGLRLSHERKWRWGLSQSTSPINAPPVAGPNIERDEARAVTQVSGTAILRYFPVEDVMLYASFANGFKSGGFNQLRTNSFPSEFGDEKSLSYEIGTKTSWLDNELTVNLTGFFTDYQDFQAQIFTGSAINIQNAGRLFSYGAELETAWSPVVDLLLGAALGVNIAEYESFANAENTVESQNQIWTSTGRPAGLAGLCGAECAQDLSGKVLDNAPRWTLNLFSQYAREIPRWPVVAFGRADYSYTSERYLAQDLDPMLLQPGVHLLDLRAGVRAPSELWELTFWVRNVTDADWFVVGFDVPIVNGFAAINAPPRTYGGTLRVKF
jgi:iron complex outermembrane receptor protein